MRGDKAVVIFLINRNRYFSSYTNKRIQTAWSLAGAELFGDWTPAKQEKIEEILKKRKIKYKLITIKATV